MKISDIQKQLQNSWANGYYIDRPQFKTPERIYITKSGNLFYHYTAADGYTFCEPTTLSHDELLASDWNIKEEQ